MASERKMTGREDAQVVLWIHETVGDNLDGNATLGDCVKWILDHGTRSQRAIMELYIDQSYIVREAVKRLSDAVGEG